MPDAELASRRRARVEELKAARANGRKVVGYLCLYAPVELIRASGATAVRLASAGAEAEERGERHLRVDACSFCKSCLGGFESDPLYRQVDAVAAVSTCDMMRRLPESIERHAGVPTHVVYLPRTAEELPARVAEFRRQLALLADWLAKLTGEKADDARLDAAIAEQNLLRSRLREIDGRRAAVPPQVSGSDLLNLCALTWLLEPDQARAILEQPAGAERPGRVARPRLLLGGSMLAENDRWLVRAVEERADIVGDTLCTGMRWFADDVESGPDRLGALARYYYRRVPCACRRPNDGLYRFAARVAAERRVQGVVYQTLFYCDAWSFEARRLRAELGLPLLHIDADYSGENREQVRTRIEAFMETM